jgi:hypothetical protein
VIATAIRPRGERHSVVVTNEGLKTTAQRAWSRSCGSNMVRDFVRRGRSPARFRSAFRRRRLRAGDGGAAAAGRSRARLAAPPLREPVA